MQMRPASKSLAENHLTRISNFRTAGLEEERKIQEKKPDASSPALAEARSTDFVQRSPGFQSCYNVDGKTAFSVKFLIPDDMAAPSRC